MKFDKNKKDAILLYLLELIEKDGTGVASHAATSLGINQSTVHRYLQELQQKGIIEKIQHGVYRLATSSWHYTIQRSEGTMSSDTYLYDTFVKPHICQFSVNVQQIWSYVITEMVNNIIDHSEAEHASATMIQNYLHTTVILSDDGLGIFEKIKNHFHFSSLDDSIIELFKGKLTTDSSNHSGEGIFFSSRIMDQFYVISSGKIFSCNQFNDQRVLGLASENNPGTTIVMSLANNSIKKSQEIFDQYSDVDGGFKKTRIPMKNAFDAPPVSRSQAKRLTSRLEQFEEVVLDFSGLDWMGQGFSHQIFSVFRNEHPEIIITPVNMSEDVRKMYLHTVNT